MRAVLCIWMLTPRNDHSNDRVRSARDAERRKIANVVVVRDSKQKQVAYAPQDTGARNTQPAALKSVAHVRHKTQDDGAHSIRRNCQQLSTGTR